MGVNFLKSGPRMIGCIQSCPHELGEDEEEEGVQDRQVRAGRTFLEIMTSRFILAPKYSFQAALV